MLVGTFAATEVEDCAPQICILEVASAIMKDWIVDVLVGCDVVQSGKQLSKQCSMHGASSIHGVTSQDHIAHEHLGPRPPADLAPRGLNQLESMRVL